MFSQYDSYNNMPYTYTYNNDDDMPQAGSPHISTPYLDSSIDTPYMENNSSSPFLETVPDFSPYLMYASLGPVPSYAMNNFNGAKNVNDNKDDVCIARYLEGYDNNNIAKLTHDPIKFNGDPSALLIDKSKSPMKSVTPATKPSPTIKLESITEENSDSLFPPLSSSQSSTNSYDPPVKDEKFESRSLDDILNFEASSPLSAEENDFDMQDEEAQQHTKNKEQNKENKATSTETVSKKRKSTFASEPNTTKKSKKVAKAKKAAKEIKTFQCPKCDHVSKRRYNLSTHIKTHDKSRVKEFNCSQCPKRFDRRHDRDRHLATVHRGERSYTCDHCSANFSRRDALDHHLIHKHDFD